ncbi:MAG: hypothetical protein LBQ67_00260, partial [Treponema sp.]|nr:hypothetical protein [Treponema sp.]
MAHKSSWLPARRDDQLHMAKTWCEVLPQKKTPWNVPDTEITELQTLTTAADAALTRAKSSERTQAVTAECRVAFEALTEKMRFIKK